MPPEACVSLRDPGVIEDAIRAAIATDQKVLALVDELNTRWPSRRVQCDPGRSVSARGEYFGGRGTRFTSASEPPSMMVYHHYGVPLALRIKL